MLTCPRCGQANAVGARFCSACGTELAAASAREVRKTVTVLFAIRLYEAKGNVVAAERLSSLLAEPSLEV